MTELKITEYVKTSLILDKAMLGEIDEITRLERKKAKRNIPRNELIVALLRAAIDEYKRSAPKQRR